MKRIFYYAFVFAAIMSCTKREQSFPVNKDTSSVYYAERADRHRITRDMAVDIAVKRLGKDPLLTKSGEKPKVTAIVEKDTLLHIVNFPDEAGYALVSTDDRQSEIVACSERGNFDVADTAGNHVMKFHVDLIMAYERNKQEQIAMGTWPEEKFTEVPDSEFDNLEAAMTKDGSISPLGDPGMPGGASNRWLGNENAIALAKSRYPDLKNFGTPVQPPHIDFPSGVPDYESLPCQTPPYCNPPIFSYDEYYRYYGCTYEKSLTLPVVKGKSLVRWDQEGPLNNYCGGGKYDAGCAAIAVAQIMVHHRFPTKIPDNKNLKYHGTPLNMDSMAMFTTNAALNACGNQTLISSAAKFVRALGDVMDLSYTSLGTGLVSALFGNDKVEKAFSFFGYNVPPEGFWPYDSNHKHLVKNSIIAGNPVFIIGFTDGTRFYGHCWVINMYRSEEVTKQTFYFDEYGQYTGKTTSKNITSNGSVRCAFGQKNGSFDGWVSENVYTFTMGSSTYDTHIRFLPNVTKP